MPTFLDIPVAASDIRPGDRLVPARGTVRFVSQVDHRDRIQITWAGFDRYDNVDDLDPHDTVILRCPTERTPGWDYVADETGYSMPCSCLYRLADGVWAKEITLPTCAWCNPDEEN
ncbi:hypothetical protein ABT369_39405 [Dactylosporangium sp. NPDC000244]|uniref:hypothetical protein n=1 Tax=Dactylosporangium sp. NPDC000244 TaxID=3154365 RepID=UPI003327C557